MDIISGTFFSKPAPVYVLEGTKKKGRFHKAKPILTITGRTPVAYEKNQVDNKKNLKQTQCSKQYLADLNDDGLLDLVYGDKTGRFTKFDGVKKEGEMSFTNTQSTLKYADGGDVKLTMPGYEKYSSPHFADWDDDGDLDLLSGSSTGAVFYFKNIGSPAKAVFKKPTTLLEGLKLHTKRDPLSYYMVPKELEQDRPQFISSVTTTDYNGDGKLDLVIGDHYVEYNKLASVSQKEFEEKQREYEKIQSNVVGLRKFQDTYMQHKNLGRVWVLLRE